MKTVMSIVTMAKPMDTRAVIRVNPFSKDSKRFSKDSKVHVSGGKNGKKIYDFIKKYSILK